MEQWHSWPVTGSLENLGLRNRQLGEELRTLSARNRQLQAEAAQHTRDLADGVHRLNEAVKHINRLVKIRYPETAFTIEELEATNPNVPAADVRMALANEIILHNVDFFQASHSGNPAQQINGTPVPFVYRL